MTLLEKLTQTRTIVYFVLAICTIGECVLLFRHDLRQTDIIEEEMRQLPRITSVESVEMALQSSEPNMYLFVDFQFPRLEYVTSPDGGDTKYIYLNYHSEVFKENYRKKEPGDPDGEWKTSKYATYYGRVFVADETELEGYEGCSVFGYEEDSYQSEKLRIKKKFLYTFTPCTFVAELGNHHANLGYKGKRVVVQGGIDKLASFTSANIWHILLGIFLLICGVVMAILFIRSLVKK